MAGCPTDGLLATVPLVCDNAVERPGACLPSGGPPDTSSFRPAPHRVHQYCSIFFHWNDRPPSTDFIPVPRLLHVVSLPIDVPDPVPGRVIPSRLSYYVRSDREYLRLPVCEPLTLTTVRLASKASPIRNPNSCTTRHLQFRRRIAGRNPTATRRGTACENKQGPQPLSTNANHLTSRNEVEP